MKLKIFLINTILATNCCGQLDIVEEEEISGQDKKRKREEETIEFNLKRQQIRYNEMDIKHCESYKNDGEPEILTPFMIFQSEINKLPQNVQERAWQEFTLNVEQMTSNFAYNLARVYQKLSKYNVLEN